MLGTVDLPYSVTAPLGCFNDIVDKPYFDVFYRYDCTVTAEHLIEMCDSAGDTYIRIYTGSVKAGEAVLNAYISRRHRVGRLPPMHAI